VNRKVGWAATVLLIATGVAYQYLVYAAAHGAAPVWLRLGLKALPLALLAWWVVARARHKAAGLALLLAAGAVLYWLDGVGLGAAAYGIPHAAIYLSLAWLFGHTLASGREPLITTLARRVHGALAPAMLAYTRHVTLSWTVFCLAQVATSMLLFRYASLDLWSLFITALNVPLLALMFVGEYLYRIWRYPQHPQASIVQAIRAFAEHKQPVAAALAPEARAGAQSRGSTP